MTDLALVTIPKRWHGVNFEHATTVPAVLGIIQAVTEREGYKTEIFDMAIRYVREAFVNQRAFTEIEQWMVDWMMEPQNSSMKLSQESEEFLRKMVGRWADDILSVKPDVVGISILLNESIVIAQTLCQAIKARSPNQRILIGGSALMDYLDTQTNFRVADYFIRNGLADDFITGDAEVAILHYLKGEPFPGINNCKPDWKIELGNRPRPTYRGLKLQDYCLPAPWDLDKSLTARFVLTQSRGCPQRCNFCADRTMPEGFTQRSPDEVMAEIEWLYTQYHTTQFFCSDLTFNANVKSFKILLEKIIAYQTQIGETFSFIALMMIHPQERFDTEVFRLMGRAGFQSIGYGFESASRKVRDEMKKGGFTNEDASFTIRNCLANDIQPIMLTMVGYPTETMEDFQETLDFMEFWSPREGSLWTAEQTKDLFSVSVYHLDDESFIGQDPGKYGVEVIKRRKNEGELDTWKALNCNSGIAVLRGCEVRKKMTELGFTPAVDGIDEKQLENLQHAEN